MVAVSPSGAIVLALNSGSSSLKYGLFHIQGDAPLTIVSGTIETTDDDGACFDTIETMLADAPPPTVIGHRIVHGGPYRDRHCLIDTAVLHDLKAACAFAPLHGPAALALIHMAKERFPLLPQAACFDTAFHADMPDVARVLPIPRQWFEHGIRRYGFHGLSCESILRKLGNDRPRRLIIAHLGNGASVTAVQDGRSIDTSMGLTPSGGVIMATRTGDIDPGVLLHLLRERNVDANTLGDTIDHTSGMLGISGLSGDVRCLRRASSTNANADLALRMFELSVCKQIAAMIASLGGIDTVVLTGGIGEHDLQTQNAVRDGLAWVPGLGIRIMASEEDEQIAIHAGQLTTGRG